MTKNEMLLGGPGLDGYVYQADTYCVSCGQGIIESGPDFIPAPLDQDSETTPQPIFFGENDHRKVYCAVCGEYLYGEDDEDDEEDIESEAISPQD